MPPPVYAKNNCNHIPKELRRWHEERLAIVRSELEPAAREASISKDSQSGGLAVKVLATTDPGLNLGGANFWVQSKRSVSRDGSSTVIKIPAVKSC